MSSWRAGSCVLALFLGGGCGITFPGDLPIGDDDPGIIGQAGFGASGAAGTGAAGFGAAGFGAAGFGAAGRTVDPPVGGTGAAGWNRAGSGGSAGMIWGGSGGTGAPASDLDRDGFDQQTDCNDLDPSISPAAADQCCDGIDNDCDGQESPRGVACRCRPPGNRSDNDGDGWTAATGDCNDLDASFFPGNPKDACCDGFDHDCDGRDDAAGSFCDCQVDLDGDGWTPGPGGDCNDNDWRANPGQPEVCDDGVDNDCNGRFDWLDGCLPGDRDSDGYPQSVDCDDWNPSISPGAAEVCNNGIDDNCDGAIDDRRCIDDLDRDGFSRPSDCADGDPSIYPGAPEYCYDGIDSNCNGLFHEGEPGCIGDADGDGFPSDIDCDDFSPSINPGMSELCGDGWDNDCDGLVDPAPRCTEERDWDGDGYPWTKDCQDGDSSIFPGSPFERCCDNLDSNCDGWDEPIGVMCSCNGIQGDNDGDGFGVGFSQPGLADCNDQDANVFPGAPEICADGKDNNCDSRVDSSDPGCITVPL